MKLIFRFLVFRWGDEIALTTFDIVVRNSQYFNSHKKISQNRP